MTKRLILKSQDELDRFVAGHGAGKAWHVVILHDDACAPGCCTCRPWFAVEPLTEETYRDGQRAEGEWARARRPH